MKRRNPKTTGEQQPAGGKLFVGYLLIAVTMIGLMLWVGGSEVVQVAPSTHIEGGETTTTTTATEDEDAAHDSGLLKGNGRFSGALRGGRGGGGDSVPHNTKGGGGGRGRGFGATATMFYHGSVPRNPYQERRKIPFVNYDAVTFSALGVVEEMSGDSERTSYLNVEGSDGSVLGDDFAGEVGAPRVIETSTNGASPPPICRMVVTMEEEDGDEHSSGTNLLKSRFVDPGSVPPGPATGAYSRMHEQLRLDAARYNNGALHCDTVRRLRCGVGSPVVEKYLPRLQEAGSTTKKQKQSSFASLTSTKRVLTMEDDPVDYAEYPTPLQVVGSRGEVRGRALVLYMMHGWAIGPEKVALEWGNLAHFFNTGYFPGPTELFDGVDYVFLRSRENISGIVLCAEHKNVKMLWVPTPPCDLCAHAKTLAFLGFKAEYSNASTSPLTTVTSPGEAPEWLYKSVVMMNSGVRGPFHGESTSSPWIDVVSMAGHTERPLFLKDDLSFRTVFAPVISWEKKQHAQSYFLVSPLSSLNRFFEVYLQSCAEGKWFCIKTAEMQTLSMLLKGKFDVFSSLQNHTFQKGQNMELLRFELDLANKTVHKAVNHNPSYRFNDPCRGIFIKFGGKAVRANLIDRTTLKAGFQVSAFMERHPWASPLDVNHVLDASEQGTEEEVAEEIKQEHGYHNVEKKKKKISGEGRGRCSLFVNPNLDLKPPEPTVSTKEAASSSNNRSTQ